jgi:hypothetical protein
LRLSHLSCGNCFQPLQNKDQQSLRMPPPAHTAEARPSNPILAIKLVLKARTARRHVIVRAGRPLTAIKLALGTVRCVAWCCFLSFGRPRSGDATAEVARPPPTSPSNRIVSHRFQILLRFTIRFIVVRYLLLVGKAWQAIFPYVFQCS